MNKDADLKGWSFMNFGVCILRINTGYHACTIPLQFHSSDCNMLASIVLRLHNKYLTCSLYRHSNITQNSVSAGTRFPALAANGVCRCSNAPISAASTISKEVVSQRHYLSLLPKPKRNTNFACLYAGLTDCLCACCCGPCDLAQQEKEVLHQEKGRIGLVSAQPRRSEDMHYPLLDSEQ